MSNVVFLFLFSQYQCIVVECIDFCDVCVKMVFGILLWGLNLCILILVQVVVQVIYGFELFFINVIFFLVFDCLV